MPAHLIGAHVPIKGGLGNAVRSGKAIGCAAIQVFTSSPQQWKSKPVSADMVADFRAAQKATGITSVVSHDSYLINLCAPDPDKRQQSIDGVLGEIGRCAAYGIPFVVSHLGAHLGQGEEVGLLGIAESVLKVLDQTPDAVTLLMETTAGQGSSLLYRFEQIARVLELVKNHPKLAVCLDTAHIFVAGYDIRTEEGYENTFEEFDRLVGIELLKVIHCNDSKKKLGTRVDRHANIGEGEIGEDAFRFLVNDPRFEDTPILIETPIENEGHERDVQNLWSMERHA